MTRNIELLQLPHQCFKCPVLTPPDTRQNLENARTRRAQEVVKSLMDSGTNDKTSLTLAVIASEPHIGPPVLAGNAYKIVNGVLLSYKPRKNGA